MAWRPSYDPAGAGGRVAAGDKGCGAWGGRPRTSDVRYGTPAVLLTGWISFGWLFVWYLFVSVGEPPAAHAFPMAQS